MIDKLRLVNVKYLPSNLEAEILYVSLEYGVAGHLCPCGCGSKIITPLGGTEWSFTEINGEATLNPSIGNWQLPCQSHYWIKKGRVIPSYQWTEKEIEYGRLQEERRRETYFETRDQKRKKQHIASRILEWLFKMK